MLIYSEQTTGFEKQHKYRNPNFWAGEVEKCDEVLVIGDYPEIAKAYETAGVKVKTKAAPKKATTKKAAPKKAEASTPDDAE